MLSDGENPRVQGRTLRQLDPIDVDWVVHSSEAWHSAETAATLKATKLPRRGISNDFKRHTVSLHTFFCLGCSFDWTWFSIFSSCGVRPLGSVSSSPPTCPCGLVGCAWPKTATHACRGSRGGATRCVAKVLRNFRYRIESPFQAPSFLLFEPCADAVFMSVVVHLQDNSPDPAHQVTKTFSLNPKSITMEEPSHCCSGLTGQVWGMGKVLEAQKNVALCDRCLASWIVEPKMEFDWPPR